MAETTKVLLLVEIPTPEPGAEAAAVDNKVAELTEAAETLGLRVSWPTPADVGALAEQVDYVWPADHREAVTVVRGDDGVNFRFPEFARLEGSDGVPAWLDLYYCGESAGGPVQFCFYVGNGSVDEVAAKVLLYPNGEVVTVANDGLMVRVNDPVYRFGIAAGDVVYASRRTTPDDKTV